MPRAGPPTAADRRRAAERMRRLRARRAEEQRQAELERRRAQREADDEEQPVPRAGPPTAAERMRRLRARRAEEQRQAELERRRAQREADEEQRAADAERLRRLREDEDYRERERQRQQQRQLDEANRERERQRQQQRQLDEANRERERQRQQQRQLDEANRERERQRQQQRQLDEANRERDRDRADRRRRERRDQSPSREARHAAAVLSGEQAVPLNTVGDRDRGCQHCGALLWPAERPSLCCAAGKVRLAPLPAPPPSLRQLWTDDSAVARIFRKHVRHLNSALALASQTVQEVRPPPGHGGYTPSVVIQGRLYHRLGPLRARDGEVPKFAQIYVQDPLCEDPEAEAALRLGHVRLGANTPAATQRALRDILQRLQQLLREHNPLVQDFIMASEIPEDQVEHRRLVISADARPVGEHARRYNRPEGLQEVSVLIGEEPVHRDIVLRRRAAGDGADLATISECHRSYEPLHFVLLYPFGTDGWHPELAQQRPDGDGPARRVTALQYAAHRLQTRPADDDSLLRACRLLQEFCCMAFARVETQRLLFLAMNQRQIRAELYQHLVDAMAGDLEDAAAAPDAADQPAGDGAVARSLALLDVERRLQRAGKELADLQLPVVPQEHRLLAAQLEEAAELRRLPPVIQEELAYDREALREQTDARLPTLLPSQRASPLWRHFHYLRLEENMRARQAADGLHPEDAAAFCEWLLALGEGRLPTDDDGNVQLPAGLCMDADVPEVIRWVFGDLRAAPDDPGSMASRAVLAARNSDVDAVNALATEAFPGEAIHLRSADAMVGEGEEVLQVPQEYLNTLTAPGFPPHQLTLKPGMPVLLLRNLSPAEGLCNGSRLLIRRVVSGRLLEATIACGPHRGRQVFLPRITLRPPDDLFPFTWARRQFPIKPAFAITVHKSQGQTLGRVAVLLTEPAFTHGQLYVAASRVGRQDQLRFALPAQRDRRTANVVYRAVLR
ncbi:Reticulocyte-binding protein 2 a [Amphibalanus amphitrite]|uniref:ATP-dependent DNA helicase n=1 Tax=Amphibalanus amphitrite TaxID=1232801 RepID=A0A6A4X8L0_AMPAM|nr:Reticulocyte-binding protein 2 a [Amphibalanus amphitrite]